MLLREFSPEQARHAERDREAGYLCLWCGTPLPEEASFNRTTCTRAHNRALSRWRTGTDFTIRIGTCESCGSTIDRSGQRGRLPRHCDDCTLPAPTTRPGRWKYKPGDRFGSLVLLERLPSSRGGAEGRFRCDCGNLRTMRINNVASSSVQTCTSPARHPDPRLVEVPAYGTVHHRLVAARGRASEHECAVSSCTRFASDWAYRHGLLDPLVQSNGAKDDGKPYSDDPDLYMPLCRPHHQKWDRAWLRQTGSPMGISLAHVTAHEATS
ncbi:hypothetical protein [Isoptericola sediminis]|uniref:Uncharacterized protein n=1 Tax=Isoptericola sediminis TaxID=2733572 RepID=A0A849K6J7_9MICO|nr:hypothetical protein [Isoptericola sediminis]NNU26797.1 hypothetical protein [Isoptericola sediminis]